MRNIYFIFYSENLIVFISLIVILFGFYFKVCKIFYTHYFIIIL